MVHLPLLRASAIEESGPQIKRSLILEFQMVRRHDLAIGGDEMNDQELIRKLSMTGKDRVTLYLSQSKVEHVYVQTVAQVTELVRTTNEGGKISGSILGFLGAEITDEGGLEAKVAMTPLLQAITAEKAAEQAERLVDLTRQQAVEGSLMRYIGPARFTTMASPLTPDGAAIPQQACDIVSQRRQIQEEILTFPLSEFGLYSRGFLVHPL
jgi:hypothetical protein